jgi:hypothetical protein
MFFFRIIKYNFNNLPCPTINIGDILLSPALFQDDVSRMCHDPVSAQMGNDRMEAMAETKLLDFNMNKSCIIIIGKRQSKKRNGNTI